MPAARRLAGILAFAVVLAAGSVPAGAATAEPVGGDRPPVDLPLPRPSWYTYDLHREILHAGPRGVDVPLRQAATELNCLGYSPPFIGLSGVSVAAVSAGGCMVAPHGCTMNFIFRDTRGSNYIGTAGHCLQGAGTVVMQVATRVDPTGTVEPFVTLAAVGKVAKKVDQGIGRDFGIVKIDPRFRVVPGVAGAAGPTGAWCGDPVGQPVVHYGHGYVFFVEQGYPKTGEVVPDLNVVFKMNTQYGYNWVGYGLPGDSGSPVMNPGGLAVGNLTHGLAVLGVPTPGLNFGTTTAGMFNILGSSYSLVTADGRQVRCSGALLGV